ncbi:MAG TPA: calcium-binding protein [Acidimicrobiales bacterium]|nr:calcium-binding protein [Acidimicrobiales bacterium]
MITVAALLTAVLVPLMSSPSGAAPICNTTPINFTPPSTPTAAILPYSPYPSTINVAGLTGTVTDVNVSLNGFNFIRPEDVDVLLVAPDGTTNLLVMSDIGGDNVPLGERAPDVNLTFDDEAAGPPPTDSVLSSGTFLPTDDDNDVDEFVPGHADPFLSPAPAPSTATTLSTFDGLSPNGTWSLYVIDDQPGPSATELGTFAGGWCIDITTANAAATCNGLTPTITGTDGNDTIVGTRSADVILAGLGDDTVNGLGGNDTICGGDGNDVLRGDSGNDTIRGDGGNDTIDGGGGDDDIGGGADDDSINANDGNDQARGDAGNDEISGGGGNDVVAGGEGNDRLTGGAGDDQVQGDAGDDRVLGGAGNDQLQGNAGADAVNAIQGDGGAFADTLNGGADPDRCFSDPGDTPPSLNDVDC